jgi:hypothetical protein
MTTKKATQKKEIIWNIINSLLAGTISFLSALIAAGELNWKVIMVSLITSALVMCVRFKNYWDGEQKEYQQKIFKFI